MPFLGDSVRLHSVDDEYNDVVLSYISQLSLEARVNSTSNVKLIEHSWEVKMIGGKLPYGDVPNNHAHAKNSLVRKVWGAINSMILYFLIRIKNCSVINIIPEEDGLS